MKNVSPVGSVGLFRKIPGGKRLGSLLCATSSAAAPGSDVAPTGPDASGCRRLAIGAISRLATLCIAGQILLPIAGQAAERLIAWGDINYELQLAPGPQPRKADDIAAGDFHSVLLNNDGSVSAWGDDRFGQINVPQTLLRKGSTAAIAAGNVHSLALTRQKTVISWGPTGGRVGDFGQCYVPAGLNRVAAIAAGAVHSLALKEDGTVVAWGANFNGQCKVPFGLRGVVAIAGGMYHSVALKSDGTVVVWGDNRFGQIEVPDDLDDVVAIAAGGFHTLALKRDGTVVSWGSYGLAQIPVPDGLTDVVAIATGDHHSLALRRDGTVVAWGFNDAGQLNVPAGLQRVIGIDARGSHSMVLVEAKPVIRSAPAPRVTTLRQGLGSRFEN